MLLSLLRKETLASILSYVKATGGIGSPLCYATLLLVARIYMALLLSLRSLEFGLCEFCCLL